MWVAFEERRQQIAKIGQLLVSLQLNGNQGQQINRDDIRDVAQNQPIGQPIQASVRQPIHQALRHSQRVS